MPDPKTRPSVRSSLTIRTAWSASARDASTSAPASADTTAVLECDHPGDDVLPRCVEVPVPSSMTARALLSRGLCGSTHGEARGLAYEHLCPFVASRVHTKAEAWPAQSLIAQKQHRPRRGRHRPDPDAARPQQDQHDDEHLRPPVPDAEPEMADRLDAGYRPCLACLPTWNRSTRSSSGSPRVLPHLSAATLDPADPVLLLQHRETFSSAVSRAPEL